MEKRKGGGRSQSANDQRSDSMNSRCQASQDNWSSQLNPNHSEYKDKDEEEDD